ncbi:uncharacterized protein SPPG_06811 [Spizellomyces punctatus DAOM BR117]|uniref:SH3 domain-containing protein n=1 Tax=Spizellomyces punctatus (strain DAOM BR117) TaxID=645134 RepID=A0A0L0H9X8_SPIPD|nr:uncharacterized protein SPPG_06811 [Spizellomyces punctatus DAOM BR117]KNC97816.1 hypothetical protein SPPG_06811 [Spizellomyces punctatus DAOM BR117]|eukprot:XP_016605856.1 hypothetical protein SPPG_06811 [Spizellomyces punctatus DAOM BR117]
MPSFLSLKPFAKKKDSARVAENTDHQARVSSSSSFVQTHRPDSFRTNSVPPVSSRSSISSRYSSTSSISSSARPLALHLAIADSEPHPLIPNTSIVSLPPLATKLNGTITVVNNQNSPCAASRLVVVLLSGQGIVKDVRTVRDPESPAAGDIHARPLGRNVAVVCADLKAIAPGSKTFAFSLPFPKSLPPTVHIDAPNQENSITHLLFACLRGSQRTSPVLVECMEVFARRRHNRVEPIDKKVDGCADNGPINYVARFPSPAYYTDDAIPGNISLYPADSIAIVKVEATWFEVYTFRKSESEGTSVYREQLGDTCLLDYNSSCSPIEFSWPDTYAQPYSDSGSCVAINHEISFSITYSPAYTPADGRETTQTATIWLPVKLQIPHSPAASGRNGSSDMHPQRAIRDRGSTGEHGGMVAPAAEKRGSGRSSIFGKTRSVSSLETVIPTPPKPAQTVESAPPDQSSRKHTVRRFARQPTAAHAQPEPTYRQGRAMYDYVPAQSDELCISEGDIISVLESWPDGWGFGHSLTTLAQGAFPLGILDSPGSTPVNPDVLPTTPTSPQCTSPLLTDTVAEVTSGLMGLRLAASPEPHGIDRTNMIDGFEQDLPRPSRIDSLRGPHCLPSNGGQQRQLPVSDRIPARNTAGVPVNSVARHPHAQIPRRAVTTPTFGISSAGANTYAGPGVRSPSTGYDPGVSPSQSTFVPTSLAAPHLPPTNLAAPHLPPYSMNPTAAKSLSFLPSSPTSIASAPSSMTELDALLAQNIISGPEYLKMRERLLELKRLDDLLAQNGISGVEYLERRRRVMEN